MFYIDQQTVDYLRLTGREPEQVELVENTPSTGLWSESLRRSIRTSVEVRSIQCRP